MLTGGQASEQVPATAQLHTGFLKTKGLFCHTSVAALAPHAGGWGGSSRGWRGGWGCSFPFTLQAPLTLFLHGLHGRLSGC